MNHPKIITPILISLGAALSALSITAVADSTFVNSTFAKSAITESTIEEIIVTSDFRDTTLLQTPASVTVIDSTTIAQRQARHLEQVLNLAPNVNFSSGASRGRFIQIRGIGERSQFIEPLNPSVATLVDGIDFTGIAGAATTMDIAQIEILRGPQGTLYGANALAGLINLRSNQPTEQFEGNFQASVGGYDTSTLVAAVGGPASESLGYRVAVQQHSSDGFIENDFLQRDDTNNIDEFSLRTILHWQASEALDMKLTLFHVDADNGYDAFSLDNTRHTLSDTPGHDRHKATAIAIESSWQGAESFKIVSLASFADNDLEYGYDEDWAFPDICTGQPCEGWEYNSADNYSRERGNGSLDIKLVSTADGRILNASSDWVLGIYWRDQDEQLLRQQTGEDGFTSDFDTTNKALYGQLDTQLSDSLTLISGLRLENRDATYTDSDLVAHGVSESLWGGRLALQYQITEDQMIYGLVSRGYKAGGVNSNPSLTFEDRQFDTELMWNVEAGIKGRWHDDRLQARLAAFYQKRDDIQIKQSLVQSREDSNAVDFTDYFGNAASGANYGLEVEFNWLATESLAWFGAIGLLSADYDIPLSDNLNSRQQAQAPDYQFSLGGRYQVNDVVSFTVDVEGKDKFYLSSSHNEQSQAYELINAQINVLLGGWELSFWGRNLTDKDVIVRGFNFAGFSGEEFYGNDPRKFYATEGYFQLGEPRMFGLSGKYDF
jgi:iron complex outermembrane recepter protein